jgi:hypothetical protein
MRTKGFILGSGVAIAGRALIPQRLRFKFSRDVARLNTGDYSGLLDAYSDNFVLHFNEGDHRWSGDWVGRNGMERFLQNSTAASASRAPAAAYADRSRSNAPAGRSGRQTHHPRAATR